MTGSSTLDDYIDQSLICHDDLARLLAFQILLDSFTRQGSGLDLIFARFRWYDNPITYFPIDLHRDFDRIFPGGVFIHFWPLVLVNRIWLTQIIRPQFF